MEKHVLLVNNAVQSTGPVASGMMVDNGGALMASYLAAAGFYPQIFDYNAVQSVEAIHRLGKDGFVSEVIEELDSYLSETKARIVGFKLYMNGFRDSVQIAHEIKSRRPDIMVIAGGPQVEWFEGEIFNYGQRVYGADVFDALVFGDADSVIVDIARHAYGESVDNIPNLIFRDNQGNISKSGQRRIDEKLRGLPRPIYDPEIYRNLSGKMFIPVIEDSRGCNTGCSFCIHPMIGRGRRERLVDDLLEEIEYLRENYGASVFRLSGPKPSADFVNRLTAQLPRDVKLTAFAYADQSYEGHVSNSLIGLFCGLESTDEEVMQTTYRKTRDIEDYLGNVRGMVGHFKERGTATVTSLIVPSPDETDATMAETLDFIDEIGPDFAPVLPILPIPGTALTRLAMRDSDRVGVRPGDDFTYRLMLYELDLIQPPENWPTPPWSVRVNGEYVNQPFAEVTAGFARQLAEKGIFSLSDEQILMAYLYNDGLSHDQEERREQCLSFNRRSRDAIANGDSETLLELISKINANNTHHEFRQSLSDGS